ncbi:Putative pterin-4-alpha-carbinolamine dehydratase [Rubripirellula lacrimiformis]|uniref:4a-hydroxytetrahydrobiopterin dehydratase n=2 Tax=Rubripirellula lacrimiformis TaxID=1930273 RepID=A0A517NFM4_9BACT|nr:Putative pterin-4-alpha-carbinolamine dehydratase [Rubripirellula lacrimiformis]
MIGPQQAADHLAATPQWTLDESGKMISRQFNTGNFVKAVKLIQQVAEIAETEQHHPDLHLTGYRHLRIDLTTHAIGGLSENDFIIAAKIDAIVDQGNSTQGS